MKPQILPRAAAGVCALLLAGGAGLAVSQARSDSALPADGTAQQGAMGRPGGAAGGPGRMDVSALADTLGVTEAKLEAAMDSAFDDAQPGQGAPDGMAAALAKALGLSVAKVAAALEANRPDPPAGGAAPPDDGATPPSDGGATPPAGTTTS